LHHPAVSLLISQYVAGRRTPCRAAESHLNTDVPRVLSKLNFQGCTSQTTTTHLSSSSLTSRSKGPSVPSDRCSCSNGGVGAPRECAARGTVDIATAAAPVSPIARECSSASATLRRKRYLRVPSHGESRFRTRCDAMRSKNWPSLCMCVCVCVCLCVRRRAHAYRIIESSSSALSSATHGARALRW
jgi:hypothetical protein